MPLISFIPDSYIEGFKKLASLSEKDFESIERSLSKSEFTNSVTNLADIIASQTSLKKDDIEEIFSSVGSLVSLLENQKELIEIVSDIAIIGVKNGILKVNEKSKIKKRLLALLSNKQLYYASKSEELISENSNVYITGKILTDIRPLFDINVEKEPTVGLILHNLHMHYESEGGVHKDIYISLNFSDIQNLVDILIRAMKKEENLQTILRKMGIKNLNE
jgi:hypothetical protein